MPEHSDPETLQRDREELDEILDRMLERREQDRLIKAVLDRLEIVLLDVTEEEEQKN